MKSLQLWLSSLTSAVCVLQKTVMKGIWASTCPVGKKEYPTDLASNGWPVTGIIWTFKCRHQGQAIHFELCAACLISIDGRNNVGRRPSSGAIVKGQKKFEPFLHSGSICIVQLSGGIAGLPNVECKSIDACALCLGYVGRPFIVPVWVRVANLGRNQLRNYGKKKMAMILTIWWAKTAFGMLGACRFERTLPTDVGVPQRSKVDIAHAALAREG